MGNLYLMLSNFSKYNRNNSNTKKIYGFKRRWKIDLINAITIIRLKIISRLENINEFRIIN